MEVEDQKTNYSSSSTPDGALQNHGDYQTHYPPSPATIIPNRIFVGGFDWKVNESDLRHIFSQHGAVKEVNVVIDRLGISRRYGFVTFESEEDALKVLNNANGICFKDQKLSIGQAVRRREASGQTKNAPVGDPEPALPQQTSRGTSYLTSTGYPYTYHNGVAYFHCPSMNLPAQHWPPASPWMVYQSLQPVYQQPAYPRYQSVPNQYQWNAVQLPLLSSKVVYSDGGSFQTPVPVMEHATPEFAAPAVQHVYPAYPQRAEVMAPIVLQHDPGKNLMRPPSRAHLSSQYRRV